MYLKAQQLWYYYYYNYYIILLNVKLSSNYVLALILYVAYVGNKHMRAHFAQIHKHTLTLQIHCWTSSETLITFLHTCGVVQQIYIHIS